MDMLSAWENWKAGTAPYVLPIDEPWIANFKGQVTQTWDEALQSPDFGRPGDKRLHLGLLPQPFCGDVANASVYVLMLNPGIGFQDYFGEYRVPEYRKAVLDTLRQDFKATDLPFMFLDPKFAWHGGFGWWHSKLVRVIEVLAQEWQTSFADARARLGHKLASIELVPYHSEGFSNAGGISQKLPSARLAAQFVREFVLPRVKEGQAIVIVARKAKVWNLPKRSRVIVYTGAEALSARLGPQSRGGRAILRHLLRHDG